MPSFLSKVFTRRREDKEPGRSAKRSSTGSLLEGKFEAVSPNVSPSATHFPESSAHGNGSHKEKEKGREKGTAFPLLRARSPRPVPPAVEASKSPSNVPHLTLNLPVPKEEKSRALGVVFEADPDDQITLPDNIIGDRRLNPLEALLLVKACSAAIVGHGGLEALGLMHPHWYSASPDVQRKLISLFILSLAPKSPITTLSPSPSPLTSFNTELEYTRSPHDAAAVLRWALRHLRLEGASFGGENTSTWQWYSAFYEAERAKSYPANAFSDILVPQLPATHLQLLVAILDLVSSLAAHSERNGISGSKLSKFLGLWLLTSQRVEEGDDWTTFYARWERAGRMLEHIFLTQIRDEMTRKKMPLRLSELVKAYPYHRTDNVEDGSLPRPRFSTRRYRALHVRVETQLPDFTTPLPKQHPLRIITDAMRAEAITQTGEFDSKWEAVKNAAVAAAGGESEESANDADGSPSLSRVFADETIRLLSLVPAESSMPTIKLINPPSSRLSRRPTRGRSSSLGSVRNGHAADGGKMNGTKSTDNVVAPKDWSDFSSTGFGESALGNDFAKTLLDTDVEVTQPPALSRKTSRKRRSSPPASGGVASREHVAIPRHFAAKPKTTRVEVTLLDEAFIDFWSDALLDPISTDWPNFVICQLRPLPGVEVNGKNITWLILEHVFTRPPPPPEPVSPVTPNRASSPRPSLRSNISTTRKISSTFASSRRRFTFFSPNQTVGMEAKVATRKNTKSPRVGEMGEILPEEHESSPVQSPSKKVKTEEPKGLGLTGVDTSATAAVTDSTEATVPPVERAQTKTSELPAIPIVETEQGSAATEDVVTFEPITQNQEPSTEKPMPSLPQDIQVPVASAAETPEPKSLPPAPEQVVLGGDTSGPQVALTTSEPATLAEASAHIQTALAFEGQQQPGDAVVRPDPDVIPVVASQAVTSAAQGAQMESPDSAISTSGHEGGVPDNQPLEPPLQSRFVEDLGSDSEPETVGDTAASQATSAGPILKQSESQDPQAGDREVPDDFDTTNIAEKTEDDVAPQSGMNEVQVQEEPSPAALVNEDGQLEVDRSASEPVPDEAQSEPVATDQTSQGNPAVQEVSHDPAGADTEGPSADPKLAVELIAGNDSPAADSFFHNSQELSKPAEEENGAVQFESRAEQITDNNPETAIATGSENEE